MTRAESPADGVSVHPHVLTNSVALAAANRAMTRYAQQRLFLAPAHYPPDELALLKMLLLAERASRELVQVLIEPRAVPVGAALGPQLKLLMTLLHTIVRNSTPPDETPLELVTTYRHVDLPAAVVRVLRDSTLLLVLCALDDGALAIEVALEVEPDDVCCVVRSTAPGQALLQETRIDGHLLGERLRAVGGRLTWQPISDTHLLLRDREGSTCWEGRVTVPLAAVTPGVA